MDYSGDYRSRYDRIISVIQRDPDRRSRQQLLALEGWFRKKSKILASLNQETLLDVIQHCEFVTREKDDVIIHQGEKGHRFYIVLRGSVSVLLKESLEDVVLGEEGSNLKVDRSTLGNQIATLGEGAPFGEIALMNPDCIRTASIVAEERTDLVVIHRELYNRSVKRVVAREYSEKINFIESAPFIQQWMPKFRKQLAASFKREVLPFDCVLFKQGEPATDMYFIVRGEVKLIVDPEAHFHQFEKFLSRCSDHVAIDEQEIIANEKAYFPQKLLPQLAKYSRVNRASSLRLPAKSSYRKTLQLPSTWSPSAIRKMNTEIMSKKVHLNLCYLGEKQCVGDVEALLSLDVYHATAVCSQETVVMVLHRSHFDRLFRKRNPRTTRDLAHIAELQLARRALKPNISDCVPLLKCFIYRLQEVQGYRRQEDESSGQFVVPAVYYEDSRQRSLAAAANVSRAYCWMAAVRDVNSDACSQRSGASFRGRSGPEGLSSATSEHRSTTCSMITTISTAART